MLPKFSNPGKIQGLFTVNRAISMPLLFFIKKQFKINRLIKFWEKGAGRLSGGFKPAVIVVSYKMYIK